MTIEALKGIGCWLAVNVNLYRCRSRSGMLIASEGFIKRQALR
jgi:hypothetical protein